VRPGQKYTWRVWIHSEQEKGPVASASFRGKAAP
jgi:hypothetical protein